MTPTPILARGNYTTTGRTQITYTGRLPLPHHHRILNISYSSVFLIPEHSTINYVYQLNEYKGLMKWVKDSDRLVNETYFNIYLKIEWMTFNYEAECKLLRAIFSDQDFYISNPHGWNSSNEYFWEREARKLQTTCHKPRHIESQEYKIGINHDADTDTDVDTENDTIRPRYTWDNYNYTCDICLRIPYRIRCTHIRF
jgi:hypothetical protein